MIKEKSCGAIIYFLDNGVPFYLLIQHVNGYHWAFVKGHIENNETEEETALREIQEETSITNIVLDTQFKESTVYSPKENVIKEVVYFVAKVNEKETRSVKIQEEEVVSAKWLNVKDATELLTHSNDKKLLAKAHEYLVN